MLVRWSVWKWASWGARVAQKVGHRTLDVSAQGPEFNPRLRCGAYLENKQTKGEQLNNLWCIYKAVGPSHNLILEHLVISPKKVICNTYPKKELEGYIKDHALLYTKMGKRNQDQIKGGHTFAEVEPTVVIWWSLPISSALDKEVLLLEERNKSSVSQTKH